MRRNQKAIGILAIAVLASTFLASLAGSRAQTVTWGVKVGDSWSYEAKSPDASKVLYYKMTVKTVADTGPTGDIWMCYKGNTKTTPDVNLATYVISQEALAGYRLVGTTESREYGGKTVTALIHTNPTLGALVYDNATGILLEISITNEGETFGGKLYSWTGETPECKADIPGFPVWFVGVFGLAAVLAILKKQKR